MLDGRSESAPTEEPAIRFVILRSPKGDEGSLSKRELCAQRRLIKAAKPHHIRGLGTNMETATRLTSRQRLAAILVTAIALAFCTTLVFGANWAFADETNFSAATVDNPQNPSDSPQSTPNDLTAAGTRHGNIPYPTGEITIGITPVTTPSYDTAGDCVSEDAESNAIYVDVSTEVGMGVKLAVQVDYMKIDDAVYDARSGATVNVPGIPDGTATSVERMYTSDTMVSWYSGSSPFNEGMYLSDYIPSEHEAYIASGPIKFPDADAYPDSFFYNTFAGNDSGFGDYNLNRISYYSDETDYTSAARADAMLQLPAYYSARPNDTKNKALYFETAGDYTFTAQFTIVKRFVEERMGATGPYVYISCALFASNPVIFRVHVAEKQVVDLNIVAKTADNTPIDINNDDFKVTLDKNVLGTGEKAGIGTGSHITYCSMKLQNGHYDHATPGLYHITVKNKSATYKLFDDTLALSVEEYESAIRENRSAVLTVTLFADSDEMFTVTFYDEDGTTILPVSDVGGTTLVDSRQYKINTDGDLVAKPTTPTKEEDDDYAYRFKYWKVVGDSYWDGALASKPLDVTCNTSYYAEYEAIPKKGTWTNVTRVVVGGGGIFTWPLPVGVSSYELTSAIPDELAKAEVIKRYSGMIGSSNVLGAYQIGVTQHNEDGTFVLVTTGVGDLNLSFNIEGIEDGTKVNILQLHETGDPNNPEEAIMHRGITVTDGKVNVTLDGRLSLFIIMETDDETSSKSNNSAQEESQSSDPADDPKQANTSANNDSNKTAPANTDSKAATVEPAARVSDAVSAAGAATSETAYEAFANDNDNSDGLRAFSELVTPQMDPADGSLADLRADVASAFEALNNASGESKSRNFAALLFAAIPFALAVLVILVLMGIVVQHRKNSI